VTSTQVGPTMKYSIVQLVGKIWQ